MASIRGRGAQVKLAERHRAASRGVAGRSLLENILAKRLLDDADLVADGLGPDASWGPDNEFGALDEVLAPNGELAGYVPGPGGEPGTGGTAVEIACRSGLTAAAAGVARSAGVVVECRSGLAIGAAAGVATGSVEIACRSGLEALAVPAGLGAVTIACRSGLNQDARIDAVSGLSAKAVGFGNTGAGGSPFGGYGNSPEPGNSSLPGNAGPGVGRNLGVVSGLSAIATGVAAARAAIDCHSGLTASATGDAGPLLPADAILGRNGRPILLRDGTMLLRRPFVTDTLLGRDGRPVLGRDGLPIRLRVRPGEAILGRNGLPILLRDGRPLLKRLAPDAVETPPPPPPPPVDPELPPDPPVVWPTTPYILLTSAHPGAVVEYQDGRTARVRLVRPIAGSSDLFLVTFPNSGRNGSDYTDFDDRLGGVLNVHNGDIIAGREPVTSDYGTFTTGLTAYPLGGGYALRLTLTVIVSDSGTGAPPAPFPFDRNNEVWREDFRPGTGTGFLSYATSNVSNTGNGTILLDGYSSVMSPPDPNGLKGPGGFGQGLFRFRIRYGGTGVGNGDGIGPATILWPYSNTWPGPEIDLGEFGEEANGLYMAFHKSSDGTPNGQDVNSIWAVKDNPAIGPGFDARQWHTYEAIVQADRCTFLVDNLVLATTTDFPYPDFLHGGENHTVGMLIGSNDITLECDWIEWTPERLINWNELPAGPWRP